VLTALTGDIPDDAGSSQTRGVEGGFPKERMLMPRVCRISEWRQHVEAKKKM